MSDVLVIDTVEGGYDRDVPIVRQASMHVQRGEVVTIIGPNGAGKSTILKMVMGVARTWDGQIRLGEQGLTGLPTNRIARLGVSFVPQTQNIFPSMTLLENVQIGLRGNDSAALAQQVLSTFPGLGERAQERAGVLSGGQRQLLSLARAMASEPELLILDEPSAGLSPKMTDEIFASISVLAQGGQTVFMVEQNARQALAISDRAYVMEQGQVRLEGVAATLLEDPDVKELFLGGDLHEADQPPPAAPTSPSDPA